MPRLRQPTADIPTFEHCNLDHDVDFPPLYFATIERRSELPRSFPHRHSYFHLQWVTEGHGRHMIDFRDHSVRDSSIFIVAPGQIHFWDVEPETQGYLFNFNAEIFPGGEGPLNDERLRARVQSHPAFYPDPLQANDIAQIVSLIAAEYRQPRIGSTEIVTHLFQVLLLRTLRIEEPSMLPGSRPAASLAHRFSLAVERSFRESGAVAEYARRLDVSERTLAEATKRVMGKTPKEIVQDRLLLEAKRLLMHSNMAVTEIAYHLNFEDPAYFGRFFRKRTNVTPGEFKKSVLEAVHQPT